MCCASNQDLHTPQFIKKKNSPLISGTLKNERQTTERRQTQNVINNVSIGMVDMRGHFVITQSI
jgi:hypothetical protein